MRPVPPLLTVHIRGRQPRQTDKRLVALYFL